MQMSKLLSSGCSINFIIMNIQYRHVVPVILLEWANSFECLKCLAPPSILSQYDSYGLSRRISSLGLTLFLIHTTPKSEYFFLLIDLPDTLTYKFLHFLQNIVDSYFTVKNYFSIFHLPNVKFLNSITISIVIKVWPPYKSGLTTDPVNR